MRTDSGGQGPTRQAANTLPYCNLQSEIIMSKPHSAWPRIITTLIKTRLPSDRPTKKLRYISRVGAINAEAAQHELSLNESYRPCKGNITLWWGREQVSFLFMFIFHRLPCSLQIKKLSLKIVKRKNKISDSPLMLLQAHWLYHFQRIKLEGCDGIKVLHCTAVNSSANLKPLWTSTTQHLQLNIPSSKCKYIKNTQLVKGT